MNAPTTAYMINELRFDSDTIKAANEVLKTLNHKLRLQLLKFIHQKGRCNVSEIYKNLRLEQSTTSQHLALLRRCHYVLTERLGKEIYYVVNYDRIREVEWLVKYFLD